MADTPSRITELGFQDQCFSRYLFPEGFLGSVGGSRHEGFRALNYLGLTDDAQVHDELLQRAQVVRYLGLSHF